MSDNKNVGNNNGKTNGEQRGYQPSPDHLQHGYQPTSSGSIPKPPKTGSKVSPPSGNK